MVKGKKFRFHDYVGDPINSVTIFNDKEVDELTILDISNSRDNRTLDLEFLSQITSQAFMPLSYGGGVKSESSAEALVKIGFEKIIIGTAFYRDRRLLRKISKNIGSQSTVVSIDVKTNWIGNKIVTYLNAKEKWKYTPIETAKIAEDTGAGEILLTSVDLEGTSKGYDLDLVEMVSEAVTIPVVAHGGCSGTNDIKKLFDATRASAACGTLFTFKGKHKAVLLNYPSGQELDILRHTFQERK